MEKFGEYLKAEREKKNIRLEEIASITKIHLHSLELLEANRFDDLPPEPFLRGFIIAYAKYVGLDPRATITRFTEQAGQPLGDSSAPGKAESTPRENPSEVIENAWQLPINKILLGAGFGIALAIVATLVYVGKQNSMPPSVAVAPVIEPSSSVGLSSKSNSSAKADIADDRIVASPSADKKTEAPNFVNSPLPMKPTPLASRGSQVDASAPIAVKKPFDSPIASHAKNTDAPKEAASIAKEKTSTASTKAKPQDTAKAEANEAPADEFKHEVSVEGKERTWIKVVIDEKPPVEFFLPKGEKASYKAKNKIKVVLGNSTGTKVVHNGDLDKGKKFQGTIRSYIFPPTARFPQDTPSKRITSSGDEMETELLPD